MKVTFWGVRGTTPCAQKRFAEFGGHTSCVSVEAGNNIIIFDAGTGIFDINSLALSYKETFLFLSHAHLDHVQGIPFFSPLWKKGYKTSIHSGTLKFYGGLKAFLDKTFDEPLFPIPFRHFPGDICCLDFCVGDNIIIDDITLKTFPLNHPNGAVGYRIFYKGSSICYMTDHEHTPGREDISLINFIKNTDLLIYDSSFSDEDFHLHKCWGHSTWQEAIRISKIANVKRLAIYHHDPSHDDKKMREIEKSTIKESPSYFVAKQGMVIDIANSV
ncbi:MAG: MBL fold metallo-hydrolase [Alphaproteobacteria bacterium]